MGKNVDHLEIMLGGTNCTILQEEVKLTEAKHEKIVFRDVREGNWQLLANVKYHFNGTI